MVDPSELRNRALASVQVSWSGQTARPEQGWSPRTQPEKTSGPSPASTTSNSRTSEGGRASRYPPCAPGVEIASPERTRSLRIWGTNVRGTVISSETWRNVQSRPEPCAVARHIAARTT